VSEITLVLLAAGNSTRFGLPVKKQWLYQRKKPLWLKVADDYGHLDEIEKTIIVASADDIDYMRLFSDHTFVTGGASRQESLLKALEHIETPYVLVNDIARCCFDEAMTERILQQRGKADVIVPALKAADTVYYNGSPVERENIKLIQTPQLSRADALRQAFGRGEYTDESSAVKAAGGTILFVEGSPLAH